MKVGSRLEKFVSASTYYPAVLASLALLFMVAITMVGVVSRKLLGNPIIGVQEYSQMALFIVIFLFLAHSGWTGSQIAVDLIEPFLKGLPRQIIGSFVNLLCAVFMGVVSWETFNHGMDAGRTQVSFNLTAVPHAPFYYLASICCALYAFTLLVMALRTAVGLPETPEE